jgi:T5SS/PEP-CTERM-associated repeat protein
MLCAVLATVVASVVGSVRGDIVGTGDVVPTDPATWTSTTKSYIGKNSDGSLTVTLGSDLLSASANLGYNTASSGAVLIDGSGSTWTCRGLYIGQSYAAGTLDISNGGQVSNAFAYLGNATVRVDGPGSTWMSGQLTLGYLGAPNLTITNGGLVSNALVLWGTILNSHSITVTVDGVGSTWLCSNDLNVISFKGALNITNGGLVTVAGSTSVTNELQSPKVINFGDHGGTLTTNAFWGSPAQFTGVGTLITSGLINEGTLVFDRAHGLNQTFAWTMDQANVTVNLVPSNGTLSLLGAGYRDSGTLTIREGVTVTSGDGYLGHMGGSSGVATVDGAGSIWACRNLTVGHSGTGVLAITDGGKVMAADISIGSASTVAMTVGDGSSLSAGTGTLTNGGVVRLTAAAGATAGTYVPITAASWAGTGTVQALGGTWDAGSQVFTVSAAAAGVPGVGVTVDRAVTQRVVITDGTSGAGVVVGFQAMAGSSNVTLTGWELTEAQEAGLVGVVPAGQQILEGWTFAAEGYTAGEPVGLAFNVGSGLASENLSVWHYDGSSWTAFAASDLAYDGLYASFTVTGFSGYAVTGVPEASTLGVLALGVVGVLGRRRRNSK